MPQPIHAQPARAHATSLSPWASLLASPLLALLLLSAGPAQAACTPAATAGDDTITCADTDTSVDAGAGDDSVDVEAAAQVDADESASDSGVGAEGTQETTAIDGNTGDDTIDNQGEVTANASADASVVAITPDLVDQGQGDVDVSGSSSATARGIAGDDGQDVITNAGTATATATATTSGTSVELDLIGGQDMAEVSLDAVAESTTLAGGDDDDTLTNTGTANANATATASRAAGDLTLLGATGSGTDTNATATARGLTGGNGDDGLRNEGTIDARATADASATDVGIVLTGIIDGSATTQAGSDATGMDGGAGEDTLSNTGNVVVEATSDASTTDVGISASLGIGQIRSATRANASATGLDGGADDDVLTNEGDVDVDAAADAQRTRTTLSLFGEAGAADDAGVEATASAAGLVGGEGDDTVSNEGTVNAKARADADIVDVNAAVLDALQETIATPTEARADATGLGGGEGDDTLTNDGDVDAIAESEAQVDDVELNAIDAGGASASTLAESDATGMAGGEGADTVRNRATVDATATATANVTQVNVSLVDAGLIPDLAGADADASTGASATATGIDGGDDDDTLVNEEGATINATATANTDVTSVAASLEGIPAGLEGFDITRPLADASTDHSASAIGMQGGAGMDTIENDGTVNAASTSTARATSVSASVPLSDVLGIDPSFPTPGLAVSTAGTASEATAYAIAGGEDDDTITQRGDADADATADALAVGVSAALELATPAEEGAGNIGSLAGTAVESATRATATASTLSGGEGDDTIRNTETGNLTGTAKAMSQSTSVSASIAGTSQGIFAGSAAFADASTTATSTMRGVDGGTGADDLFNDGSIVVDADTDAGATNVSVAGQIAINQTPAAVGLTWTRAGTSGDATSVGMDGGEGDDELESAGDVTSTANADVSGTNVSGDIAAGAAGVAISGAVSQVGTDATATATGLGGGAGDDDVTLGRSATVDAIAKSRSTGISTAIQGEVKGVSAGAALGDASTTATADARGLTGGSEDDALLTESGGTVTSTANADAAATSVSVDFGLTGVGLSAGAALSRTNTTADADAVGMGGDEGDDEILNQGDVTADATSIATSASVGVALEITVKGAALGATLTDATTDSTANATALAGGDGMDTIENQGSLTATTDADATSASVAATIGIAFVPGGAAIADTTTDATAESIGIDGGEGDDTASNSGSITTTSEADAIGVPVGVAPLGASIGDTDVTATAISTAMDGGAGDDMLMNLEGGTLTNTATSDARGTVVTFTAAGASLGDVTATSNADATGMHGGAGDDVIEHRGTTTNTATATLAGNSVNVTVAGASLGDATSIANANARGLSGGEGNDRIDSFGAITSSATANTPTVNVNVTGVGAALGDSSVESNATATGIDGGADDDLITSSSVITSTANATTGGANVSVTWTGASLVDAGIDATADAAGIRGGSGNDESVSDGTITATATADANATSVVVNVNGAALGDTSTTATAIATGMEDGEGDDLLENSGTLDADASATADANDVAVGLLGAAIADADVTAEAFATGLAGGAGNDTLLNTGRADADADATLDAANTSFELAGFAKSTNLLTANATATGMAGGEGDDSVRNEGELIANATATSDLRSTSVGIIGVATTGATANTAPLAIGMSGGEGMDTVENFSTLDIDATVDMDLSNTAFEGVGVGSTTGVITAQSDAIGLAGDAGNDTLRNAGTVEVDATSDITTNAQTTVIFGVSKTGGSVAEADPTAIGMDGGDGDDTVLNEASLDIYSSSTVTSDKSSYTFAGGASTGSVITAAAESHGAGGSDGSDTVMNDGSITVEASSSLTATGGTNSTFGNSSASAETDATSNARGLFDADDEFEDTFVNTGSIDVTARASSTSTNRSDTGFLFGDGRSDSDAFSHRTATGIDVGSGGGMLVNDGSVIARTAGHSNADADSDGGDFVNGDSKTDAFADSTGTARGVAGNSGALTLMNLEGASIEARAEHRGDSNAFSDGDGLDGDGTATARTIADGVADGVSLGSGAHVIENDGTITAVARPTANAFGESDADEQGLARVTATANADGDARGVHTGDGGTRLVNRGTIDVTANPLARNATGRSNRVSGAVANVDATVTTRADADARAWGVKTGNGDDEIDNQGTLTVTADAEAHAIANADGDGANGDSTANPTADSNADAWGIDTSDGDDTILNSGTLTVLAETYAFADADANADTGIVGNDVDARSNPTVVSDADAKGIVSLAGDNTVMNFGTISVTADQGTNTADGDNSTGGGASFQVDGTINANATGRARARGIQTGIGDDHIENHGDLTVIASPFANADADAKGKGLDGDAFAYANAFANDAYAAGIETGDGTNTVVNTGIIDVRATPSASADADASPGAPDSVIDKGESDTDANSEAKRATAIGILGGSGDDTVVNEGTITTTTTGIEATRVAIRTQGGNDTVMLGDASVTTGAIELGDGDDTLALIGTPTVNGAIAAGSGSDGLLLDGSGSFADALSGFDRAHKTGEGTYSLASITPVRELRIDEGSLEVQSGYAMAADASLHARIDGDGTSGSLRSSGAVSIDGTLEVERGPHSFYDGQAFDVVSGSSVSGTFASTLLPDPTPLLSFDVAQEADAFQVIADAESFASVGGSVRERRMGAYLDGLLMDADGDLALVLGELQGLPGEPGAAAGLLPPPPMAGAAHGLALATLGPSGFDDLTLAALTASLEGNQRVQERMRWRRNERAITSGEDRRSPLWSGCEGRANTDDPPLSCGLWITGWGRTGKRDAADGFVDVRYKLGGFTAGIDHAVNDNVLVGASIGVVTTAIEDDNSNPRFDAKGHGVRGSIYGSWHDENAYLEGIVSYGGNYYRNTRYVTVGMIERTGMTRYEGSVISALLGGGYDFDLGEWRLGPYGWVHFAHLADESSFERGAGDVSLALRSRTTDNLVSLLGARVARPISLGGNVLVPALEAGWQYDANIDDRVLRGNFTSDPNGLLRVDGRRIDRHGARVAGSLQLIGNEWLTLSTRIGGDLRGDAASLFGGVQLSGRF